MRHRRASTWYLRPLLGLALASLASLTACHGKPGPKPKVVVSIFPLYDLTRRVAGPDAEVVLLEPPEASEHQFSPSPGDMERATGAKLAVMVGLDLDAWLQPVMTRVSPSARVLKLGDRVPTLPRLPSMTPDEGTKHSQPNDDPRVSKVDAHVWLDPQRALLMARAIGEELSRVDPSHAGAYRSRSLEVTQSLDHLDHEIEARTAAWKQRSFVTLHDDFLYYAVRYHLELAAIIEPYAGIKPKIRYEQLLLRRLRERGAAGVFGEPQLDSQPAEALAMASKLPYGVLDPLGGTNGVDSYEALIRSDTDALEKVLAAPPAPASDASPAPSAPLR